MDCSTPGFPVLHHFPELPQTHVHWVGDATQPSHPLSSPSPPAFNLSPQQGLFLMSQLFASGCQSIGASASASVLLINIQVWFPLVLTGLISLLSIMFYKNEYKCVPMKSNENRWYTRCDMNVLYSLLTPTLKKWKLTFTQKPVHYCLMQLYS